MGFALIFGITLLCYYPSFTHLLRGETYTYLLDTKGTDTAYDLITKYSFYEKVRIYDPGDRWLFKPLLFIIVGVEKALFGVNALYWRIAAFAMHLIAVFALYRLLWRMKPGVLAVSVTLFFSIMYIIVNTVLYEQIASYMLFTALVLTALYHIIEKKDYGRTVVSLVIASFIYEVGIVFVGVFLIYILFWQKAFTKNWQQWAIALGCFIPVYFGIYLAEKLINPAPGLDIEYGNIATVKTIEVGITAIPGILWMWVKHLSLPSIYGLVLQPNLRSYASQVEGKEYTIQFIFNVLALSGIGVMVGKIAARVSKIRYQLLSLPFLTVVSLVATIAIFRTNTHGIHYITENSFNAYMFCAFFAVLFYAFILGKKNTLCERRAIAGFLIVPIFLSGMQVYTLNRDIKEGEAVTREYLAYIDKFVTAHKNEADFTFRADSPLQRGLTFNLWTVIWSTPPEKVPHTYSIPEALYADYWQEENPKYVLEYPQK